MLKIDLAPGESVTIGGQAVVTLEEKSGKRARLSFKADRSVPIKKVAAGAGNGIGEAAMAAAHGIGGLSPA